MSGPPDLTIREAVERWLDKRSVELRPQTTATHRYRLKLLVDWCKERDITHLSGLSAWDLDSYETERRSQAARVTLSKELGTVQNFFEWTDGVGLTEGLAEVIEPPAMPDDPSSDVRLEPDDATDLLSYYRESPEYATRGHVLLELTWHTGARAGGIRALDVRDFDTDEQFVRFVHRPDSGTPLKNGSGGERVVGLTDPVADVLIEYLEENRAEVSDDHGRQPLLASQYGRPTTGSIRDWMYLATVPCHHSPCPHDKDRPTCEWTTYGQASKCPSSRSPHQVRTGSITWMRHQGVPRDVVKDRVNASEDVLEKHYDKADAVEEMERRRREYIDNLEIDDNE